MWCVAASVGTAGEWSAHDTLLMMLVLIVVWREGEEGEGRVR
jgi:hypothetical protein